ncbi:MAG: ABC transporter permease [Acidimicrobiales bacterium]
MIGGAWTPDGFPADAARMRTADLFRTALDGLRAKSLRTFLTAVGIAAGIGSMVSVIGISSSSRADVVAQIDRLGTNLLAVQATPSLVPGRDDGLPPNSVERLRRIPATEHAAALTPLDVGVTRNDLLAPGRNGGVTVAATEPELVDTLSAAIADGRFISAGDTGLPLTVLGAEAARRLGIDGSGGRRAVVIGGHRFAVVGVLETLPLNPDVDRMVLVGTGVAGLLFGTDPAPETVYVRVDPASVAAVAGVAARTADPADPDGVAVSRPSEALEVQAAIDDALANLLIGLGAVALLVGAIGIANVMVIAVVERRVEIGVRRALGATRRHIAVQFVAESAALAALGGVIGIGLGAAVTIGYSTYRGWPIDVPVDGLGLSAVGALVLGAVAGTYPAARASRLDPAEAVRAR